jgi:hypothetical protein
MLEITLYKALFSADGKSEMERKQFAFVFQLSPLKTGTKTQSLLNLTQRPYFPSGFSEIQ